MIEYFFFDIFKVKIFESFKNTLKFSYSLKCTRIPINQGNCVQIQRELIKA